MFGRKKNDDMVVLFDESEVDEPLVSASVEEPIVPAAPVSDDRLVSDARITDGRRGRVRVRDRLDSARSRLEPYAATTRHRVAPTVAATRGRVLPAVVTARGRIQPAVGGARGRIAPVVTDAKERLVPAVAGARDTLVGTVGPTVAGAVTTAVSAAREGSLSGREARVRVAAALAALRGELPERQRRWPVVLISLLAGAAAGATAGLLARRAAAPGEPTYIPAARPAAPPSTTAAQPAPETSAIPDVGNGPVAGQESNLGWPEQLDEPLPGSDESPLDGPSRGLGSGERTSLDDLGVATAGSDRPGEVSLDEVDLTLVEDSSETHKPTH